MSGQSAMKSVKEVKSAIKAVERNGHRSGSGSGGGVEKSAQHGTKTIGKK